MELAIKGLKKKKAPGVNGVRSEVVRNTRSVVKGELAGIVNMMLVSGRFPDTWKVGEVKLFLSDGKPKEEAVIQTNYAAAYSGQSG